MMRYFPHLLKLDKVKHFYRVNNHDIVTTYPETKASEEGFALPTLSGLVSTVRMFYRPEDMRRDHIFLRELNPIF